MEAREPVDLLVKASGLSRRAFAHEYGVGEQVLLRLSQGRSTDVPQSVVNAVYAAHGESVAELLQEAYGVNEVRPAYAAWREEQRGFGHLPEERELKAQDKNLSPAQRLAAAVGSMSKLAKVTRTHDYVVRRYVNGETRELPKSMREAMDRLKWPHADQLDRAQQAWLDRQGAR